MFRKVELQLLTTSYLSSPSPQGLALTEPSSTPKYWAFELETAQLHLAASQLVLTAPGLVVLSVEYRNPRELGKFYPEVPTITEPFEKFDDNYFVGSN